MSSGNCSTIYPEAPIANMTAKTLPGGHYNIVNLLYSDSCLPKWEVDGFCVHEPVVGINSIIALLIGIYVYGKLKVLPTRGAGLYAWTFLTYGVMMTTGLFVHCLLYDNAELEAIVGLWVSTLTTAIAVGFGFCALSDLGVIDSDKFGIRVLVILIDIAVYVAYTRVKSFGGFFYLYVVPIVLFCGGWVLVQAYICKITRSYVGVPNLILAAVSGGLGLNAIFHNTWLCIHISPYFDGQSIWYAFSNVSVFCVYKYYYARYGGALQLQAAPEPRAMEAF